MSWLQTHTGRAFDLLNPTADMVDVIDIEHALARVCRFTGHTDRHYSVAEHCCHVSDYLGQLYGPQMALAGLLHDAHEAYTNDLPYPVQVALEEFLGDEFREAWKAIQGGVDRAILEHLGVDVDLHDQRVKEADLRILLTERNAMMATPPAPWDCEAMGPLDVEVYGWGYDQARTEWRFRLDVLR